jgi:hypothetical protein
LHYLDAACPGVDSDAIFITAIAPWTPMTSNNVTAVAALSHRRQCSGYQQLR